MMVFPFHYPHSVESRPMFPLPLTFLIVFFLFVIFSELEVIGRMGFGALFEENIVADRH